MSSLLPAVGRRVLGLLFPEGGQGRSRRNAEHAARDAHARAASSAAARDLLAGR